MKYIALTVMISLTAFQLHAQEEKGITVNWNAYAELYYSYDFNKPVDHNKPPFLYSHNRSNEFNLNLGYLKGSMTGERVRANLALAAGTYINANYSSEPGVLKNIYEASAGIKLSKKENLWFDIGIMPSHIGFESAISKDCWTLTRSIMADNSPYYETGAKLSYTTKNEKWFLSGMILNGWQRIKKPDGIDKPSFGTQVTFKPSPNVLINHSSFFGTDHPDSTGQYRIFQNLYSVISFSSSWGLTLGFDYGLEKQPKPGESWYQWYSPVAILRFQPSPQWAFAGRGEFYEDAKGVIIPVANSNGFSVSGYSLNIDHMPAKWVSVRLEIRTLLSQAPIFVKGDETVNNNTSISFSTAVSF